MAQSGSQSDWEGLVALLDPKSGDRILDIGAGKGEKAAKLLQAFPTTEVYAVDPDAKRIADAKRDHPSVKSSQASAESLPFDDSYFDKAYSTMALHHFADLDRALAEICRILKDGGSYVILEVEPMSLAGRLFRFFGRVMGERTNMMTKSQCLARLKSAKELEVVTSTDLDSRYLVLLRRL